MIVEDLSMLADQLRREGFVARNLAREGIMIWEGCEGFFLSTEELKELPGYFTPRDFHQVLELKRARRDSSG